MPFTAELTGFPGQDEPPCDRPRLARRCPLSEAWITDELLASQRRLWSKAYGRLLSEEETVEILMNIRRFAEVALKIDGERIER